MSKITLNNVADLTQVTSAQTTINTNSSTVQTAFDNTLSRDGTSPNQMLNNLDMNNNQVLNLPSPATVNSPARLIDVASNPSITVPPVGTSGAVVPLLNTANTWSGVQTFNSTTNTAAINTTGNITATGNVTAAAVVIDGATSGTVTLDTVNAAASGTVLVPNGPATLLSTAGNASNQNTTNIAYTNTVDQMAGLGFRFTPTYSSRVLILFTCQLENDNASDTNVVNLRFGTGSSPVAGAAATGTRICFTQMSNAAGTATMVLPASMAGIATGLTPGVSIWVDVSASVNAGTGHLFNPFISLVEI